MHHAVGPFNWSLKLLLATEPDSFNQARYRILYVILVLSLIKIGVTIGTALYYDQPFQLQRALVLLVVYGLFLKVLLGFPNKVYLLTHLMVISGLILTSSIIFLSAQKINLVTIQFVFMVLLSSLYLLGSFWGIVYSSIAVCLVIAFLIINSTGNLNLSMHPEELAFPGQLMIAILNFVTFIVSHFLYRNAFHKTIVEKEELNKRLEAALTDAQHLANSKMEFLSTMSHELRTPLNIVIGLSDILKRKNTDPTATEDYNMIGYAAANLHSLINDILDYNKIESGKLELEKVSLNLDELIHSACLGLMVPAREKGLQLKCEVDEGLRDQFVLSDPTRLSQIIYNLVSNGIKFTPAGMVTLTLRLLEREASHILVQFEVKDTGIGIEIEKQEIIFEPFLQASSSTTRHYGGTGLGLSIVRKLLSLFNSEMHLQSEIGKGSVFTFSIQFQLSNAMSDIQVQSKRRPLSDLRILVAEDNLMNIYLIRKVCKDWGVVPEIAENGIEAVRKMSEQAFDVVLMDIHMPEMDGFEAARLIRNLPNGSRDRLIIIALTASISGDLDSRITEHGINDYIRKPFVASDLMEKIWKQLKHSGTFISTSDIHKS